MKYFNLGAVAGLALTFCAGASSAATLSLATETPNFSSSSAFVDFLNFDPDGDLSTFGADVDFTNGVSPVGFTELGFGIGYSLADPTGTATGGFDVTDENGLLLGGDLLAVGFSEDVIELQFDNLIGSGAGSFGSSVLMVVAFSDSFDELGSNPFDDFADGFFYDATISVSNVAAIPLPAGLPLLLTGFLGLGLLARRRKPSL